MSQRTVMFISQTASPFGGVETWLEHLCEHLSRSGEWRPVVGIVRGLRVHDAEAWRAAHPKLETVEIDGRGLNGEGRIRAVMRTVRKVRPDILVPLIVVDAHDATCRLKLAGDPLRYFLAMHGNLPRQIDDARRLLLTRWSPAESSLSASPPGQGFPPIACGTSATRHE